MMTSITLRFMTLTLATVVTAGVGDAFAQAAPAAAPPSTVAAPLRLSGFSVILVLAERTPSGPSEPLPPGAAKAVADLAELMPFKSYRLLDAQWTTGSNRSPIRLRGPENKVYALKLSAGLILPGKVAVSECRLWEAGDAQAPAVKQAGGNESEAVKRAGGQAADKDAAAASSLIDTSFGMDLGETVVVGTSGLKDNSALVILLTAKER